MYTPLNDYVFNSAFAGAMAGMCGQGMGSSQAPNTAASYAVMANAASAFAQSYDTNRGAGATTDLEARQTEFMCYVAWSARTPTLATALNDNDPSTWTGLSADILAAVNEGLTVISELLPATYFSQGLLPTNYAFCNGATSLPTAPTAGMNLCIGAALVKATANTYFRGYCKVSAGGFTAADTVDFSVQTQTSAIAIALGNATQAGPGTGTGGAFVSNAAAGITVTAGGGGTAVQNDDGVRIIDATDLGYAYEWSNIFDNSTANTAYGNGAFTSGNSVLLQVMENRSAHTNTFSGFSIGLEQLTPSSF
jgi:hypothetical protein